jgi:hypothetical protein
VLRWVEALLIQDPQAGVGLKVWKARVDTEAGSADARQEAFAHDLVTRMVEQGVL